MGEVGERSLRFRARWVSTRAIAASRACTRSASSAREPLSRGSAPGASSSTTNELSGQLALDAQAGVTLLVKGSRLAWSGWWRR